MSLSLSLSILILTRVLMPSHSFFHLSIYLSLTVFTPIALYHPLLFLRLCLSIFSSTLFSHICVFLTLFRSVIIRYHPNHQLALCLLFLPLPFPQLLPKAFFQFSVSCTHLSSSSFSLLFLSPHSLRILFSPVHFFFHTKCPFLYGILKSGSTF